MTEETLLRFPDAVSITGSKIPTPETFGTSSEYHTSWDTSAGSLTCVESRSSFREVLLFLHENRSQFSNRPKLDNVKNYGALDQSTVFRIRVPGAKRPREVLMNWTTVIINLQSPITEYLLDRSGSNQFPAQKRAITKPRLPSGRYRQLEMSMLLNGLA